MDIDDGQWRLLLLRTFDYRPVILTPVDLQARDFQALAGHKSYARDGTIFTLFTENLAVLSVITTRILLTKKSSYGTTSAIHFWD